MGDYCSFTKAVEQLGDRWSLVIVRELLLHGVRGYSDLLGGVPGISRSVLATRLRQLRELGLVELASSHGAAPRYQLTRAGRDLEGVLGTLRSWSERFLPEDPAMVDRDPDIVVPWLARRVDTAGLPDQAVVVEITLEGGRRREFWLVLERDAEPSVCIQDPGLAEDRKVFLEADVATLSLLSRGLRDWPAAIADGSVRLYGDPAMLERLPRWFASPTEEAAQPARTELVAS